MKIRTLATTALVWVTLLLIGKQLSAQSLTQLRSLQTEDDLSVMVQAIEMTTPTPASTLPLGGRSGTYYSAQFPSWPPLPANLNQVPVWSLGGGMYLLDDTNVDYTPNTTTALSTGKTKSGSLMAMDASGPPSPGGGGSSTNVPNNYSSTPVDYGTNLCLAQLYLTNNHVTAVASNTTADIEYEVQTNSDLTTTNWGSTGQFILGSETTNWTPLNAMPVSLTNNLFFRLKSWADNTGSGIPDWWWLQYFGQDTNVDPYADPDGDGWNNLQEFQNGTDPTVFNTPAAPQGVTVIYNVSNETATISWLPAAGAVTGYTITDSDGNIYTVSNNITTFTNSITPPPGQWDSDLTYTVEADYDFGNSTPSALMPLEASTFFGAIVSGAQGVPLLLVSTLPTNTTAVRLSERLNDGTVFTNLDIHISSFTNNVCILPNIQTACEDECYWYGQTVGADGSLGAKVYFGMPFVDYANNDNQTNWLVPPYYDGQVQLKQNLIFQLRAAGLFTSFQYEISTNGYNYRLVSSQTNYAYAGLYDFQVDYSDDENNLYYLQSLNPIRPFLDNNLYRNFVFTLADVDDVGHLTTGANLDDYQADLDEPVVYQFHGDQTALLSASSSRWLLYDATWDYGDGDVVSAGIVGETSDESSYCTLSLNSISNWFGLPYVSANVVYPKLDDNYNYIGLATNVLYAGSPITYSGNDFYTVNGNNQAIYPETAQPQFQTVEYDFWPLSVVYPLWKQSGGYSLPGNPYFSPTNVSQNFFITPVGSSTTIVGYAKLAVTNGYPGVYGYLGQYFDQAYVVDTNGSVTTNTTGIVSPYGNFFATEPGQAALLTTPDVDTGERGTCMVYSVALQLDKNHDGIMDTSWNGADDTSQSSPFVFWINNDNDGTGIGQDIDAPKFPDSANNTIQSMRDLEDFARLWIEGMPVLTNGYQVTLSWANISRGNPSIKIFPSRETDGGTEYLTDTNLAQAYVNNPLTEPCFGTVTNGANFQFPNLYFTTGGTKFLLFEGVTAGAGELVLKITDSNGNTIAQTGVWLDLHDVKDLYEQAHIAGVPTTFPAMIDSTNASGFVSDHELPLSLSESNQLVVFVHGWRMSVLDYQSFSDTMFKRFYWAGYQGRFAALRWPTLSADDYRVLNDLLSYTTYNRSEYIAHRSADGASAYFDWLKSRLPNYSINVAAHSMGNIVMMETLKNQLAEGSHVIDNYVMMQAAVPAQCYDTTLANYSLFTAAEVDNPTPDVYRGFPGNIAAAVNGSIMNFFNTNDYALASGKYLGFNVSWEGNQLSYKPDTQWNYSSDGTNCSEFTGMEYRTVTDPREQMAFVARPRSKAVGALEGVAGQVDGGEVDLTAQFNFQGDSTEHSAEFNWSIQQLGGPNGFYKTLLQKFFP